MLNRLISKRVLFISGLAVLATAAVAFTFTQAVAYSAFAAAVLKVAIILLLYEGLDRYLLEGVDTISELKDGNVAVAVTLLALALLLAPAVATGQHCPRASPEGGQPDRPAILNVALQEVGVTETPPGSNEGSRIGTYMEAVGLSDGYPWCAGAMRWMMDQAKTDRPTVRSASATDYVTGSSIEATEVLRGTEPVPDGTLVIWRRGDTWKGHIGVVRRWHQRCGRTVEGNTSPGESGPQRDGDGVWTRHRCIRPGSYFRIIAFTPTT
jgi:hypothetical protein